MTLTNSQKRKKKKQENYEKHILPFLEKNHKFDKIFHFYIDDKGCLFPKRLPKNGDLVTISPGKPKNDNVMVLRGWVVDGTIHLMSNVVFWHENIEYTYQVLMSENFLYGIFSLVNKVRREQYPGRLARTSNSGGTINGY